MLNPWTPTYVCWNVDRQVRILQLARSISLEEDEATALAEVSRNIFCKFSEKKHLWDAAVQAMAQLDALLRWLSN